MFLGLRSLIHPTTDIEASKAFFTAMLGTDPYFDQPGYAGYNVGGFELGIWPGGDPTAGPVAYWGVDNIDVALAHLVALGASALGDIDDVGESIRMIQVVAPTGDTFGLIENPGFVAAPPPMAYNGPGR
jgi:predicted enzyme related to lactoylglutathione lyase